ncbi:MAG TPA: alpha/beta hydrolase [Polyangiales bacterium]
MRVDYAAGVIAWLQRKLLFPSHLVPRPPADAHLGCAAEQSWLPDAKVEVWFLPGRGVTAATPGPLLVFAHGNGELIDDWPQLLAPYRELGLSVLLPEFRGYGRSAGQPSEAALVRDFEHALQNALADPRVDGRVVYHGRSLGGGVVCALARRHPPKALVLESTFTSVADVARGMGIPRLLVRDPFESLPVVQQFAGPVLVFHGVRDRLIPVAHARRLAAANPRAKLVLYDAGHNDLPPPGADYWLQIERLLRSIAVP